MSQPTHSANQFKHPLPDHEASPTALALSNQAAPLRDDTVKFENLSTTKVEAEEIIRMMRVKEAVSVWGAEHNDIEKLFPGMEFLTSKSVIVKTTVFGLLHKVCLL